MPSKLYGVTVGISLPANFPLAENEIDRMPTSQSPFTRSVALAMISIFEEPPIDDVFGARWPTIHAFE
jgi:hypothetical protein